MNVKNKNVAMLKTILDAVQKRISDLVYKIETLVLSWFTNSIQVLPIVSIISFITKEASPES